MIALRAREKMFFTWGRFRKKSEALFQDLVWLWSSATILPPLKRLKKLPKALQKLKNFKNFWANTLTSLRCNEDILALEMKSTRYGVGDSKTIHQY